MNEFFTNLSKEGKKNGLSASEKSAMLARIKAEMKAVPPVKVSPILVKSPYAFLLSRAILVPFIMMLVVIGGASAYAAEGALPGDLLYPIKVSVTEPVREALAFSAEAKAAWHAEAVGRRMREAETLALRGELTPSKSAEIIAQFDRHISMVEVFLGAVESNSPLAAAEISARFAGSLAAYGANLLKVGLNSMDIATRRQADSLAEHVKTRKIEIVSPDRAAKVPANTRAKGKPSSERPSSEASVTVEPTISATSLSMPIAIHDLKAEVLASLSRAELQHDNLRSRLGSDANHEIELRVSDIRKLIAELDSFDEKKSAAVLERVQLASKHLAGLEAFLKERAKGGDTSSSTTPSSSGASGAGTVTAPSVPVVPPVVLPQPTIPLDF